MKWLYTDPLFTVVVDLVAEHTKYEVWDVRMKCVDLLLSMGASPNKSYSGGKIGDTTSCLKEAVTSVFKNRKMSNLLLVQKLLEHGACPTLANCTYGDLRAENFIVWFATYKTTPEDANNSHSNLYAGYVIAKYMLETPNDVWNVNHQDYPFLDYSKQATIRVALIVAAAHQNYILLNLLLKHVASASIELLEDTLYVAKGNHTNEEKLTRIFKKYSMKSELVDSHEGQESANISSWNHEAVLTPTLDTTIKFIINFRKEDPMNKAKLIALLEAAIIKRTGASGGAQTVKHNGRSYKVRTGSRGGKYILVGADKKKIYV